VEVELHPDASSELLAATRWYEERRIGLAGDFVGYVTTTLARIAASPTVYPIWPGTERAQSVIRRAVVSRFPYVIAFEVHLDRVLILAVAHAKRRPLYWFGRAG
jgi:plasmid stabilization system protein ParE